MNCAEKYTQILSQLPANTTLLAVSKTKPAQDIMALYNIGCRDFGENKVQELAQKQQQLPKDIRWHQIGHLQTNKVKYIIPYIHLIHSVDTTKLAAEINRQAARHNRTVDCLLQIKVTDEDTKTGFDIQELQQQIAQGTFTELRNIRIRGLMAMASHTDDTDQIRREFTQAKDTFDHIKTHHPDKIGNHFDQISMGMSGDYQTAIQCGSTIIRIGSTIFGPR